MISANELMVGNRFNRELKSQRGLEYDPNFILTEEFMGKLFGGDISIALQDLFPIPLTEEILVKCGLKKEKASNYGGADSWQGMGAYSYNGDRLFRGDCKGLKLVGYFNTNFEYLHQIQNIMYFLYGKELEVNL